MGLTSRICLVQQCQFLFVGLTNWYTFKPYKITQALVFAIRWLKKKKKKKT